MRLVRYTDGVIPEMQFELHPKITVISGLQSAVKGRLLDTFQAIPRGVQPPSGGVIEAHGVRLDLTPESLELLELAEEHDVVISAADLPRPELSAADRDGPADAQLSAVKQRMRDTELNYEHVVATSRRLRHQMDDLIEERIQLDRQVESARSGLDNFAEAALVAARDELDSLQRAAGELTPDDLHQIALRKAEIEGLDRQIHSAMSQLDRLRSVDPDRVRLSLRRLQIVRTPQPVPCPEATAAAEAVVAAQRALLTTSIAGPHELRVEEAAAAHRAARFDLLALERDVKSPPLPAELVEMLERTRDELVDLHTRRRGRGKSKRLAQLAQEEHNLLLQLGFTSWTTYIRNEPERTSSASAQMELHTARRLVVETEERLKDAIDARDADPEIATRRAVLRHAVVEGCALLDAPVPDGLDDASVAGVIDALRRKQTDGTVDVGLLGTATDSLIAELERAGVTVQSTSPSDVERSALSWLENFGDPEMRVEQVEAELAALNRRRDAASGSNSSADRAAAMLRPQLALDPRISEARSAVAEHIARVERHHRALANLSELRARYELLKGYESQLRAQMVDNERMTGLAATARHEAARELRRIQADPAGMPMTAGGADSATSRFEQIEWFVLAKLAQQRAVSYAGSVPLVIDDAFSEWSFVDVAGVHLRLERMSAAIQIVYLTSSPEVLAWARRLGPDRASVIELHSVVPAAHTA